MNIVSDQAHELSKLNLIRCENCPWKWPCQWMKHCASSTVSGYRKADITSKIQEASQIDPQSYQTRASWGPFLSRHLVLFNVLVRRHMAIAPTRVMLSAKDHRARQLAIVENTLRESQSWAPHVPGSRHLRALGFVERLLHSLWPSLATVSDGYSSTAVLRVFLRTVIFRSQSTHHTLLTACYYLVLFHSKQKGMQTSGPFDMTGGTQCLQPHARIFLSALILGWKFTQDCCYTTLQWTSISGFSQEEINADEAHFLSTIDWRLYISRTEFEHWYSKVSYHIRNPTAALCGSLLYPGATCGILV